MRTVEELQKEILDAHWIDMRFHLERGSLFSVSSTLDLAEVGVALASDQVHQVEEWIRNGDIARLEKVNQFQKEDLFSILIVQPFVLAQKMEKKE